MHFGTGLADLLHLAVRFGTGGRLQTGVEHFQLLGWDALLLLVAVAYNL